WLEQAARRRAGGDTPISGCAAGSWGGGFYCGVRPGPDDPIVTKNRYSAFYNTNFDNIFLAHRIRTLGFTGVVTHMRVESSAREAFVRDYYVVVVSDGTAAYVPADHDMTLKNIDRFFGEIASMAELTALWPARNTTGRGQ